VKLRFGGVGAGSAELVICSGRGSCASDAGQFNAALLCHLRLFGSLVMPPRSMSQTSLESLADRFAY
jgi:hypothetical protein